jgi:hypothetical protein
MVHFFDGVVPRIACDVRACATNFSVKMSFCSEKHITVLAE